MQLQFFAGMKIFNKKWLDFLVVGFFTTAAQAFNLKKEDTWVFCPCSNS